MIKCLHISANTFPPLNGKHHLTKEIWIELAKGFDEYHILARGETQKYSYSQEGNIHLHLVPKVTQKSKIFFLTSFWMFWLIYKYKITHLLSQCPIVGGFAATLASKYFKIPLMVEINGRDYIKWDEKNSMFGLIKKIQNYVFKNATKIRYPNNDIKHFLEKNGFEKNAVFIPHRVKHELFNKQKENFEIGSVIKIVSIGRFVWEKDYLFLIESLMDFRAPTELTLIGGGSLMAEYSKLHQSRKSNLELILIDFIPQKELIDLVIKCDLFIQSSVSETGPRTLLEAMALKMPVLSSNVGFFPDIVDHYHCGIMYEASNKAEFIMKLDSLLESQELRSEIANNAYFTSKEKYDWQRCFEIYRNELITMNI